MVYGYSSSFRSEFFPHEAAVNSWLLLPQRVNIPQLCYVDTGRILPILYPLVLSSRSLAMRNKNLIILCPNSGILLQQQKMAKMGFRASL